VYKSLVTFAESLKARDRNIVLRDLFIQPSPDHDILPVNTGSRIGRGIGYPHDDLSPATDDRRYHPGALAYLVATRPAIPASTDRK